MADKIAHAVIDWKRTTDVCMDIHCECRLHSHFDGYEGASPEYVYCSYCKGVNRIGARVGLQEEELKFDKRGPHVFLQWKGTHVYMQVHCTCGLVFAANGDFKYEVECQCGKRFNCDPDLSITKLSAEEAARVAYVTPQEDILDMINED
jgi:hypothetical protein